MQRPPTANTNTTGGMMNQNFGIQENQQERLFSSPAPPQNNDIPDMKHHRPHTGGSKKPPKNRGVSQPHPKTQRQQNDDFSDGEGVLDLMEGGSKERSKKNSQVS